MNIKKNGLTMLLAIVFLAGCANPPTLPPPSANLTPAWQTTITSAMTLSPESTPTAMPESRFTRQCLPVDEREFELNEIASGTILFSRPEPNVPPPGDTLFILKDIQTGSEYKLPAQSMSSLFVSLQISPNRKMLAQLEWVYNDQSIRSIKIRNVLWIFDARANVVAKIAFNRTDLVSLYWLDDERLIIYTEEYGNLLLVNPFTGEQKVLANELPNLDPNFKPGIWWPVVYSPDLEWVAYYSLRKENGDYVEGPAVYNVVKKQTLWNAGNGVGSDPAWSLDGQELAFTGGMNEHQLYLFSHLGQVKAVLDESLPHEAFAFSWSPDGRYIAFWNAERLMVYDRQMDWVFDTCISTTFSHGSDSDTPDWSPDSQQIIVMQSSAQPLLVDWQKKMAYKIKEKDMPNSMLGAWMNSLP